MENLTTEETGKRIVKHKATLAVATSKAWDGLGEKVTNAMTAEQAMKLARLDFEIGKAPIYCQVGKDSLAVPNKFATYRTDNNKPLGVVGNSYTIIQNKDLFGFFDNVIEEEKGSIYESAGCLGNGERVFLTAKMPHYINIAGTDDMTTMYVLLMAAHDGTGAVTAAVTPIRIACENALTAAVNKSIRKISIRHSTNALDRLKQAQELLGITNIFTRDLAEAFNFMAKKSITDSAVKDLIAKIFVTSNPDSSRIKNIHEAAFEAYQTGIGQESILGTAWGAYNGITNYLDHSKKYRNDESKFNNLLFGNGATMTQNTMDLLLKM